MVKGNAISVRNVTKTYKLYTYPIERVKEAFHPFRKSYHHPFHALTDISIDIQKGETAGIIGRNGSGKSTLLQVICGILQPSSGSVSTNGRISALLELGAGFNPEFTGRQNVYINAAILGLSREEIDARFQEISTFAAIGEYIDQPVKSYSSGMYIRLAFSVAIHVEPDILVVDEALAVGDTLFQAKCFAKFREFQKKGVTIIFVTHSLDMITRYCTKAYLLEQGTLLAGGNPKDIVDEYNRMIVNCSTTKGELTGITCVENDQTNPVETETEKLAGIPENRYGVGKAKITGAEIRSSDGHPVKVLSQGEWYEIRITGEFFQTIDNPIFAFTIKDVRGFDISGTNTSFLKVPTGIVQEGDILTAGFKQKITLNPGEYLLSLGCTGFEKGEYVVYERRYDYMTFEVVSHRGSVGIFDLDSSVTIIKGSA
ncbi:MAG: ABC transporter ATP-binding protein [Desulfobacteraceae bacterium]|nr:MAG: ABC transporter ATP-binding protein [Desulfobacteraceae bacterium]